MRRPANLLPYAASCFAGFAVMSLELLGSRLVAPVLGSSILIWTNLIGVILLALAFGAWFGGSFADRSPDRRLIAGLLFGAGLWSAGLGAGARVVLEAFGKIPPEYAAPFAALFLLAPPAFLLGAVPPAVLRLSMKDIEHSGRTAGMLSALGTVGSLFGTYATGYFLLPKFRTSELLLGLAFSLASAAFLILLPTLRRRHAAMGAMVVALASQPWAVPPSGTHEYPSAYAYVAAVDAMTKDGPAKSLVINKGFHAAATAAAPGRSVLDYARGMRAAGAVLPPAERMLTLGGGGFHVAREYLEMHPSSTVDVVEIDPTVALASREIFGLQDDPRLRITYADARTEIRNRPAGQYQLLIQDTYGGDTSVPWHLITKEAFGEYARLLTPDGTFMANVIMPTAPIAGTSGYRFSQDFAATAASSFAWTFAISMMNGPRVEGPTNVLFFAGNGTKPDPETIRRAIDDQVPGNHVRFAELPGGGNVWTDDFGPADFESMAMYRDARE